MNKADADKAYERGRSDRRNGKARSQNPYIYRSGIEADVLVEQWTQGHDDESREIRGKANGQH